MSIKYKGVIDSIDDAKLKVPKSMVKYIDLELLAKEGKSTAIYNIVSLMVPVIIFSIKYLEMKETPFVFNLVGIVIGCVLLLPHELLHGMCFSRKNNVCIYQMINPSRMFITSDELLSRKKFIFMSLLPSIMFGLLPLIAWLFVSPYTYFAKVLFSVGFINIITGGKDYMNVIKTVRYVPRTAKIQMAGLKVYYI